MTIATYRRHPSYSQYRLRKMWHNLSVGSEMVSCQMSVIEIFYNQVLVNILSHFVMSLVFGPRLGSYILHHLPPNANSKWIFQNNKLYCKIYIWHQRSFIWIGNEVFNYSLEKLFLLTKYIFSRRRIYR